MADDIRKLLRKLDLLLYAQAEASVKAEKPHISEAELQPAIRLEEKRLREAFDNRPGEEMQGPGIREF